MATRRQVDTRPLHEYDVQVNVPAFSYVSPTIRLRAKSRDNATAVFMGRYMPSDSPMVRGEFLDFTVTLIDKTTD